MRRYRKKSQSVITAVQLDLKTDGFRYEKWGGEQQCKPGDWLVNNGGDVYTVDQDTFSQTYREVAPGRYKKTAFVEAEVAESAGSIKTKEGETHYEAGDYLVYNDADRTDGYAVDREKFQELYEPVDTESSEEVR